MELKIQESPLSGDQLKSVGDLYGGFDPKYRNVEMCRHLFNENPAGTSIHLFAYLGDRPIAHCCLIPFRALSDGQPVMAGKPECFAVEPDCRDLKTSQGIPLGLAIPSILYKEAFERGFAWLQILAPPEVAKIHKIYGFKQVSLLSSRWIQVLWPKQKEVGLSRRMASRALAVYADLVDVLLFLLSTVHPGSVETVDPGSHKIDGGTFNEVGPGATGVQVDLPFLEWLVGLGLKCILDKSGQYLLYVVRDNCIEIVYSSPLGSFSGTTRLLKKLRNIGLESRCTHLFWWDYPALKNRLARTALMVAGYLPMKAVQTYYFHPGKAAKVDLTEIAFTPFFYIFS